MEVINEVPQFPAMNDLAAWNSFFRKIKAAKDAPVPDFERILLNRVLNI